MVFLRSSEPALKPVNQGQPRSEGLSESKNQLVPFQQALLLSTSRGCWKDPDLGGHFAGRSISVARKAGCTLPSDPRSLGRLHGVIINSHRAPCLLEPLCRKSVARSCSVLTLTDRWTSSIHITWKLVGNAESVPLLRPTESAPAF